MLPGGPNNLLQHSPTIAEHVFSTLLNVSPTAISPVPFTTPWEKGGGGLGWELDMNLSQGTGFHTWVWRGYFGLLLCMSCCESGVGAICELPQSKEIAIILTMPTLLLYNRTNPVLWGILLLSTHVKSALMCSSSGAGGMGFELGRCVWWWGGRPEEGGTQWSLQRAALTLHSINQGCHTKWASSCNLVFL